MDEWVVKIWPMIYAILGAGLEICPVTLARGQCVQQPSKPKIGPLTRLG
jgi:hypothetical protein